MKKVKLVDFYNDGLTKTRTESFEGREICIKERLSMSETLEFVTGVTSMCYDDDNYFPELVETFIRAYTVAMYTNIEIGENMEKEFLILSDRKLTDFITTFIDAKQYEEVLNAVYAKIDYINSLLAHGLQILGGDDD